MDDPGIQGVSAQAIDSLGGKGHQAAGPDNITRLFHDLRIDVVIV